MNKLVMILVMTVGVNAFGFDYYPDVLHVPNMPGCQVSVLSELTHKRYNMYMPDCNPDSPMIDDFIKEIKADEREERIKLTSSLNQNLTKIFAKREINCVGKVEKKKVVLRNY